MRGRERKTTLERFMRERLYKEEGFLLLSKIGVSSSGRTCGLCKPSNFLFLVDLSSTPVDVGIVEPCKSSVFPGAWTAILVSLDNAGMWNLRTQKLDSWYLGQEAYVSVVNPENDNDEVQLPGNAIYCGELSSLQKQQAERVNFSGAPSLDKMIKIILVAIVVALLG